MPQQSPHSASEPCLMQAIESGRHISEEMLRRELDPWDAHRDFGMLRHAVNWGHERAVTLLLAREGEDRRPEGAEPLKFRAPAEGDAQI